MAWSPDSFFLNKKNSSLFSIGNNIRIPKEDLIKLDALPDGGSDVFNDYVEITDPLWLPSGWIENGNRVFLPVGGNLPDIRYHVGLPPCTNARLFLSGRSDYSIMVWGSPSLYMAPNITHPSAKFYLGDGFVYLGRDVRSTYNMSINCRNGGNVVLEEDLLISSDVVIMTDDCHTIFSKDNMNRINPYGGTIWIRNHVWLGMRVQIMGDTKINADSIVGANSFVRNMEYPESCIIAGVPGRVVKRNVTWDSRDLPPGQII